MDTAQTANANANAMLGILNDPSLYLVDGQGHAVPMSSSYAAMYRTRANNFIANNASEALAYNDLVNMRFGPASAAHLDAAGIWMVIPDNLIQSGASRAAVAVEQPAAIPLPAQSQQSPGGWAYGGSNPGTGVNTSNPVLPNNTPNPVPRGTISPGANANAQDAAGGSTQSGGTRDIWDVAINGPSGGDGGAGGAGGAGEAGGIDPKLVMYGLIALVGLLAISK